MAIIVVREAFFLQMRYGRNDEMEGGGRDGGGGGGKVRFCWLHEERRRRER